MLVVPPRRAGWIDITTPINPNTIATIASRIDRPAPTNQLAMAQMMAMIEGMLNFAPEEAVDRYARSSAMARR